MAVLKYKNENGQFVTLTNYTVQPITPVQTTGTSLSDIMSQKAVSDELNKKVNDSDLNGKIANAISSEDTVKNAIAGVVEDSPAISGAINTVVADSIKNNETVNTAVEEAVAAAISGTAAVSAAVESVVDTKLTAYSTTSEADGKYASKTHTHNASDITDFNTAVSNAVSTDALVSGTVKSVVEKYIYGDTTPTPTSSVVTTDNLNTTLADYVKDSEINTLVSNAIKNDEAVSGAVTDAVAEAIAADDSVKQAVEKAIADDTTVSSKFGHVAYDSATKKINFFANSSSSDVIEFIDATDFIKDGMVDNVSIDDNNNLVITFNTDSRKETISIPLTSIFDPSNYYTKTEIANALNGKADLTHTHASNQITDFSSAVEGVVSTSTTITNSINTIVAQSLTADTGDVKASVNDAITSNTVVVNSKAVTDFYSGHNNVTSLANIPTDKRLVIATINGSTNELSLNGNALTDGYEIHVIVKNDGTEEVTVTLPEGGNYVTVGDTIKIAAGKYGEINIISDGDNLYVRGA